MALTGLTLHHVAIRIRPGTEAASQQFFQDVLGLRPDAGVPEVPGIPLSWMDVGETQVHLFALDGVSQYARTPDRDPFTRHIAFGVPDISAARAELERLGTEHWRGGSGESMQVFVHDPTGNLIELHQADTCRCRSLSRSPNPPAPQG